MMMAETEQPPSPSLSPASSPSHDFSFESSFVLRQEKSKNQEPFAVDLSPADDIFLHGHLLPLRVLSPLPSAVVPPRNSSDSFTPPSGNDNLVFHNQRIRVPSTTKSATIAPSEVLANTDDERGELEIRQKHKSKLLALFRLQRRKVAEVDEEAENEKQSKRKIWLDVGRVRQVFKSMMKPFSLFRSRTEGDIRYSSGGGRKNDNYRHTSGNITTKDNFRQEVMRRGQYASAPASMRGSPTNGRILIADIPSPKAATDSTIEELQGAIQAAILHCKNSIAKEETNLVK